MIPDSEIRQQIGRYKILSQLGRGSMGRVYLARDPNIDREVALKVLEPVRDLSADEQTQLHRRFVFEAQAAGKLNHPGIVAVYDAGSDLESGLSYIAMEWVQGRSLLSVLHESGPLPAYRAVRIVRQVAEALDTAHQQGVIHRDIKPANLLLDEKGAVKISDFGIAKFTAAAHTIDGGVLGTPYYMSPEQLRSEPLDGRSDLFSLGVVLYQCVTGEVPFAGESLGSITYKILEIDPRPPRALVADLPQSLCRVIDKAIHKLPAHRYQSGQDLAQALAEVDLPEPEPEATPPVRIDTPIPVGPTREPSSGSGTLVLPEAEDASKLSSAAAEARGSQTPKRRATLLLRMALLATLIAVGTIALLRIRAGEPPQEQLGRLLISPTVEPLETDAERPLDLTRVEAPPEHAEGESENSRSAASATSQKPPPSQAPKTATLSINHRNRLRNATMSIRLDGELAATRRLRRSKSLFKRITGEQVRTSLRVTEGRHLIEIRITGSSGKIRAANKIHGWFRKNEERSLSVSLIAAKRLMVHWKN